MLEEETASFLPVFVSSPRVYTVTAGHTARLECQVDRLGPMVLSWKRVENGTTNYVATGKLVMVDNSRFSVLTSTASSTLLINCTSASLSSKRLELLVPTLLLACYMAPMVSSFMKSMRIGAWLRSMPFF